MKVSHVWDGFLSLLAAIATVFLCGVPVWFTYVAIDFGFAPAWVWVAVVGLAFVGIIMSFAFLRKAAGGIAPSRDRRRR